MTNNVHTNLFYLYLKLVNTHFTRIYNDSNHRPAVSFDMLQVFFIGITSTLPHKLNISAARQRSNKCAVVYSLAMSSNANEIAHMECESRPTRCRDSFYRQSRWRLSMTSSKRRNTSGVNYPSTTLTSRCCGCVKSHAVTTSRDT